ncbi:hypothetical protein FRC01_009481 [Tulasnella sp. 417]|nr:hypothetical protein FRC01_009481 [Tulasnella sp. 417]
MASPLPALQIASLFLPGDPGSGIALNAPALNKLHICARKKVRLVECHALKSLSLQGLLDWAGIMLSLLDCSEIERLSIVGVTGAEFTSPEKPIPTSIALPALKELELNSELGDLQFLARLEVPQLQTLTFKCYSSPVPFTLPPSASSLVTLRFTTGSRINAIRRAVAAQPLFQQLTVEIDASAAYRPKHAPRNDFEQVKSDRSWLERHARIKWIGQESVPSHLFQTWEAAHGLVPL